MAGLDKITSKEQTLRESGADRMADILKVYIDKKSSGEEVPDDVQAMISKIGSDTFNVETENISRLVQWARNGESEISNEIHAAIVDKIENIKSNLGSHPRRNGILVSLNMMQEIAKNKGIIPTSIVELLDKITSGDIEILTTDEMNLLFDWSTQYAIIQDSLLRVNRDTRAYSILSRVENILKNGGIINQKGLDAIKKIRDGVAVNSSDITYLRISIESAESSLESEIQRSIKGSSVSGKMHAYIRLLENKAEGSPKFNQVINLLKEVENRLPTDKRIEVYSNYISAQQAGNTEITSHTIEGGETIAEFWSLDNNWALGPIPDYTAKQGLKLLGRGVTIVAENMRIIDAAQKVGEVGSNTIQGIQNAGESVLGEGTLSVTPPNTILEIISTLENIDIHSLDDKDISNLSASLVVLIKVLDQVQSDVEHAEEENIKGQRDFETAVMLENIMGIVPDGGKGIIDAIHDAISRNNRLDELDKNVSSIWERYNESDVDYTQDFIREGLDINLEIDNTYWFDGNSELSKKELRAYIKELRENETGNTLSPEKKAEVKKRLESLVGITFAQITKGYKEDLRKIEKGETFDDPFIVFGNYKIGPIYDNKTRAAILTILIHQTKSIIDNLTLPEIGIIDNFIEWIYSENFDITDLDAWYVTIVNVMGTLYIKTIGADLLQWGLVKTPGKAFGEADDEKIKDRGRRILDRIEIEKRELDSAERSGDTTLIAHKKKIILNLQDLLKGFEKDTQGNIKRNSGGYPEINGSRSVPNDVNMATSILSRTGNLFKGYMNTAIRLPDWLFDQKFDDAVMGRSTSLNPFNVNSNTLFRMRGLKMPFGKRQTTTGGIISPREYIIPAKINYPGYTRWKKFTERNKELFDSLNLSWGTTTPYTGTTKSGGILHSINNFRKKLNIKSNLSGLAAPLDNVTARALRLIFVRNTPSDYFDNPLKAPTTNEVLSEADYLDSVERRIKVVNKIFDKYKGIIDYSPNFEETDDIKKAFKEMMNDFFAYPPSLEATGISRLELEGKLEAKFEKLVSVHFSTIPTTSPLNGIDVKLYKALMEDRLVIPEVKDDKEGVKTPEDKKRLTKAEEQLTKATTYVNHSSFKKNKVQALDQIADLTAEITSPGQTKTFTEVMLRLELILDGDEEALTKHLSITNETEFIDAKKSIASKVNGTSKPKSSLSLIPEVKRASFDRSAFNPENLSDPNKVEGKILRKAQLWAIVEGNPNVTITSGTHKGVTTNLLDAIDKLERGAGDKETMKEFENLLKAHGIDTKAIGMNGVGVESLKRNVQAETIKVGDSRVYIRGLTHDEKIILETAMQQEEAIDLAAKKAKTIDVARNSGSIFTKVFNESGINPNRKVAKINQIIKSVLK